MRERLRHLMTIYFIARSPDAREEFFTWLDFTWRVSFKLFACSELKERAPSITGDHVCRSFRKS